MSLASRQLATQCIDLIRQNVLASIAKATAENQEHDPWSEDDADWIDNEVGLFADLLEQLNIETGDLRVIENASDVDEAQNTLNTLSVHTLTNLLKFLTHGGSDYPPFFTWKETGDALQIRTFFNL